MGFEVIARTLSRPDTTVSFGFCGTPYVETTQRGRIVYTDLNELARRVYNFYNDDRPEGGAMSHLVAEYLINKVHRLYTLADEEAYRVNCITQLFIGVRNWISSFLACIEIFSIRELYALDYLGQEDHITIPRGLALQEPLLNAMQPLEGSTQDHSHFSMEQALNVLNARVQQEARRLNMNSEDGSFIEEAFQHLNESVRVNANARWLHEAIKNNFSIERIVNGLAARGEVVQINNHKPVAQNDRPPESSSKDRPKLPAFEKLVWSETPLTRQEIQNFFSETPDIDVNALDHGGQTLLFRAIERPHPNQELIAELLSRGAWYKSNRELISRQELNNFLEAHLNPRHIFFALFYDDKYREDVMTVLIATATTNHEAVPREYIATIRIARNILMDLHQDLLKSFGGDLQSSCCDELWPVFSIIFSYLLPVLNRKEIAALQKLNEEAMKLKMGGNLI